MAGAGLHLGDDRQWVLTARIVRREVGAISETGGDLPHQGSLGVISITTTAEHHEQAAVTGHELAPCAEHVLESIGSVGVVDDDGERLIAFHSLEPTGNTGE